MSDTRDLVARLERMAQFWREGSKGRNTLREAIAALTAQAQEIAKLQEWLLDREAIATERDNLLAALAAQRSVRHPIWSKAAPAGAGRQDRLRKALRENVAEILQQSGKHYTGCTCTFCNVVARSEAALAPFQRPPKQGETKA